MPTNKNSELNGSAHLAAITMAARIPYFDPQNNLRDQLAEVWEVVGDKVEEHVNSAANMLLRNQQLKRMIDPEADKAMREKGRKRVIYKYTQPIDQAWVELVCSISGVSRKIGVPIEVCVATVHAGAEVFRAVAMERLQAKPEKMRRVVQTISKLEALEIELIVAMMSKLDAQAEQIRLVQQSEEFEQQVIATVTEIVASSVLLRAQAEAAASESHEMLRRSTEVASATTQNSVAMRETAQLTTQLARVIDTTYNDIGQAAKSAFNAADQSEMTMETVATLAQNAREIESVLSLIKNIAGQTNLLALNATIEAARAGEAGRGFSVVAQEVKSLAGQVAKATDEIARQISAVQTASEKAVAATRSVGERVSHIYSSASDMHAAIGDQMTAVKTISTAVVETTSSADNIAVNINSVRSASERMATSMMDINRATLAMDSMMDKLRTDLDIFRKRMNAAA